MARTHRMKLHTKILLAALTTAAVIGGGVALAEADYRGHHGKPGGGERIDYLFERYDTNQDGKITKAEIEAVRKASIAKYDADKDGKLSLEEFNGLHNEIMRHRMVRMFQKFDRDGDSKVTEAEIARKVDRMMAWMDRDENGEIERGELRRPYGMGEGRHGMDRDDDDRGHHGMNRK